MPPSNQDNPFCTRHIRPGAIPFLFPPGENAEAIVDRLRRNGWRGEIVGPHGSGKSALLAAMIPAIELAGRSVVHVELHDGQRRLPLDLDGDVRLDSKTVLIVDGCEQLSRWRRFLLKRLCRRRGWGLLVTAHASVGLPPIYETEATPALASRIVAHLTSGRPPLFSPSELDECLTRRGGNLREMLFDLYDLYERRESRES